MCLAIYKPATTKPDWRAYENGWESNSDSWGFAAIVDGKLVVDKGLGSFEQFRRALEPYADCAAIIHFRYATHGKVDTANAHPFMVSEDLAMIHNGVLNIDCNLNKNMSDTWHFNELVLKPMLERDPNFFTLQSLQYVLECAIKGSKIIFLHRDGRYVILNESDGKTETDGHWYSNCGYQTSSWWRRPYRSTVSSSKQTSIWSDVRDDDDKDAVRLCDNAVAIWDSETEEYRVADAAEIAEMEEKERAEEDELDEESSEYNQLRRADLVQFGFSSSVLDDVEEMLGFAGVEALHDLI